MIDKALFFAMCYLMKVLRRRLERDGRTKNPKGYARRDR